MSAPAIIETAQVNLETALGQVRALTDIDALNELRARIEAARAWAKVHRTIKKVRLDLLRVEVEALARIAQLGGLDSLAKRDHEAATYLGTLTDSEREQLVKEAGPSVTTAAGLVATLWRVERLTEAASARVKAGRAIAQGGAGVAELTRFVRPVGQVLRDLVDRYTEEGQPFTVGSVAADLIEDAAIGDFAADPTLNKGVEEVCRDAIRRSPVVEIDGTILPRLITALDGDGEYVRIPIEHATLAHLASMCDLRREQLAQDQAALDRLEEAHARLTSLAKGKPDAPIGKLIAASLRTESAA